MPKVMIVDDDRTTVSLLKTLLEMDGFDVVLVPRGSMVMEKATEEKPDVFLIILGPLRPVVVLVAHPAPSSSSALSSAA